ncbi:MAG: Outer membrane porin protein [Paracidovorax wautersii]|uniref:Outer membrane porin protein n=1 Tax=Paracidovorax wautersii TaxID=1177982 RepID=A0A7V8JS67_9BURK|nr:MAG: Outer membrane porin protein [Paracidovorax wautersii]
MKTFRKLVLAASLSVCAHAAQAQGQTQIYGVMDMGVEYLDRVEGQGSLTRVPALTGGQLASRLGFRGTEDLGNGLKANFVLESGFSPGKGQLLQSGRLFGRHPIWD